jgi:hypothetical protein
MKDFVKDHPWMTFFIVTSALWYAYLLLGGKDPMEKKTTEET